MDTQVAAGLAAIRQHDPALDEYGLQAEARRIVAGVYDALNAADPSISRPVMGDAAWEEQRLRIADLQAQGRRHAVDNVTVSDARITEAHTDGVVDTVTMRITYVAQEHDVEAHSGHDVPGGPPPSLAPRVENWILQRPATAVTPVPGATQVRCPTCGATLAAGTSLCTYCHQPIPAGGGWRVTLVTPAAPAFLPQPAPLDIQPFYSDTSVGAGGGGIGCGGWIGIAGGALGLLVGIVVPIVVAVHNHNAGSSSGSGGSIFPDPVWSGTIHISGGYEVKDTAFTSKAGNFDLTCGELAKTSPNPSMTDAVPDINVTLPDKTNIFISTPTSDADYTGPGTYTFGDTGNGNITVTVLLQGNTKNSLLYTNQNPQASTTVTIKADGSGSVTFTHLNDPFNQGQPNEFADGGYSWTCSQSS